jgi:nucleotide-binding universal stress UspA family protein
MFKTIVAGTDGSTPSMGAVAKAVEMAKLCGAELHLVRAYTLASQAMASVPAAEAMVLATAGSDKEIHDEVAGDLEALAESIRKDGVKVTVHAYPQAAAGALLDIAKKVDAQLIVTGNKGMKGVRRVLGSVPNTVAHQAQCAVMIVPTV